LFFLGGSGRRHIFDVDDERSARSPKAMKEEGISFPPLGSSREKRELFAEITTVFSSLFSSSHLP